MKYILQETQLVNYGSELEIQESFLNSRNKVQFNSPEQVGLFCTKVLKMDKKPQEEIYVLALNTKLELTNLSRVYIGTINISVASPREIFRFLFLSNANSFIMVHNHPSGDCTPSVQDIELTQQLKEAGNLLGCKLNDHIIIGEKIHYSFQIQRSFEYVL
jgi:DNA repair protein RadC